MADALNDIGLALGDSIARRLTKFPVRGEFTLVAVLPRGVGGFGLAEAILGRGAG